MTTIKKNYHIHLSLKRDIKIPFQAVVSVVEFEHLWNKQSAEGQPLYKHTDHQSLELNCKSANFPQGLKGQPVLNQLKVGQFIKLDIC